MHHSLKITIISLLVLVALVFANGCYYVFWGQEKSMEKIRKGGELNLYECCSVYTMHMASKTMMW